MRKLLLIVVLVSVAAIAFYRQRLFLHDPMGKVLVAGVRVPGARVLINYSNDVLIVRDGGADVIVQGWDRMPGRPDSFSCFRALACVTANDRAPKVALRGDGYTPGTTMGDREVSYRDETGAMVRVLIR